METDNERLSANLRKTYTAYKKSGSVPVLLGPVGNSGRVQSRDAKNNPPPGQYKPWSPSVTEQPAPEVIRPQSTYNLPQPRNIKSAKPLSFSEDGTYRVEQNGEVYEYEVDDAAGIPSVGFFKKQYTLPLNRQGRLGGSWRHIQQCTVHGGSNLLYVDGKIKDQDCDNYPPFGIVKSKTLVNHLGQRLYPKQKGTPPIQRAKKGFQYWYKEPKANILEPPPRPVRTISGQQYKVMGK